VASTKISRSLALTNRKVAEVLPLRYLQGLSTGDFVPALE